MTQAKVVGRRLGFWQGTDSVMLAIILVVCPLCVILSVRWFLGLGDIHTRLDNDLGDTVVGGALALAGLGIGAVGISLYRSARRAHVIVSVCPVCGAEGQRDFGNARNKGERPVACGYCLAYLRVDPKKLVVREEPPGTCDDRFSRYEVRFEQYDAIVPRGVGEDRPVEFTMPTMCSVCCTPDAPILEEISDHNTPAAGGFIDAATRRPYNNSVAPLAETKNDRRERSLKHLKRPSCSKHINKNGWWHALEYERGSVRFASYPYYQEFCALNHISEGGIAASEKASASGPPQAVARLRDERPEDRNSSS
jgi:hypothetical protein